MIYRMLAVNLDGALLSSKGKPHKITKNSLREVANKGVEVAVFTSLSYQHALKICRQLPGTPHIISNQGGFIAENTFEPIFVGRITESNTLDIIRLLESMDCHIRIIHEETTLANTIHFPNKVTSKIKWASNDYTFYTQQYVESLTEHLIVDPLSPLQIDVYFESDDDRNDATVALKTIFKNVTIRLETDGRMIILPEKISLASSLKYLCGHLKFELDQTVVVGCREIDTEIVELAGLGIATANASLSVKNVADWITRSNDELGVSYVVREVFRKQQPLSFLKKMRVIR